jgi:UDP-N-acetylglucosamine 1-carboxyvinyltransferase
MNETLKQIGVLIKSLREEKGLTQKDLGVAIGTTQSAVARMENGEQNLSTEMFSKISLALNKEIVRIAGADMSLEIKGGQKLSGSVTTATSKNIAMGVLAASLLNKGKTVLKNMPSIEEVHRIVEVLQSIGVSINWVGNDLHISTPKKFALEKINRESAMRTRSVIMFIGPLIHSFKKFSLPQSGGCKLGSRSVRPHFYALENLGVNIDTTPNSYEITHSGLNDGEIILSEAGDTVTENAIMAAAMIPGKTVIKYASANYQVQDLCFFLEKLGVKIEGIGTSTITVYGVNKINEDIEYEISEDPTDSMFFLASAILTNSEIEIKRCPINFLELELFTLSKMGFKFEKSKVYKAKNGRTNLCDIKTKTSKLIAPEDKIHALPYPGLNMDNLPFFAVIATQATGTTLIHDWVYEKRAIYYTELDKLGAETVLADPHRIYITGKSKLKPAEVVCPPALRPATIILIGMLGASGKSILRNVYSINRGYENLVNRLQKLGAKVSILQEFTS